MHPSSRLVLAALCLAGAACGRGTVGAPAPTRGARATTFAGWPQVGALFSGPDVTGFHFCTASVVHSRAGDLVVTAAHCVSGTGRGLDFAPGYHDGQAPFGVWPVTAAYVSRSWRASQDPKADVAFLVVAPRRWRGRLEPVEAVVGGDRLATGPRPGTTTTVVGYPAGSGGRPVRCTNVVTSHGGYPEFDCGGFVGGTSGGPWIATSGRTARGALVGVIGGLHQGGCSPSVSYSAPFGPATEAVYLRAEAGGPGDDLPAPGGDGC